MRAFGPAALVAACVSFPLTAAAQVPPPDAHFGFQMGDEGRLVPLDAVEAYFERVAAASDRVVVADLGQTTDGHRTIAAIVSSAANIRDLDRIREVNQQLADPRLVPATDAPALTAAHKVVVAIGCGVHAAEVGATQAANELLHHLATAGDPETMAILDSVVVVLIPSLNPDGYRAPWPSSWRKPAARAS